MATQKTYSSEREIAEIWKLFRETDRQMKETDRIVQETAQQMKETDQRLDKIGGDLNRKWGRLVESLVGGNLIKLLNDRNMDVKEICERVKGVRNARDKQGRTYDGCCEIDILARNGANIVTVEVKTTLSAKDVDNFLYKLKNFTCFFPSHRNSKIYGAMAYLTVDQNADQYAKKQGLFTIKATGDSAYITNTKSFKPKVFFPG